MPPPQCQWVLFSAGCGESHVHLWSTASQQVNQSRVKGHDGIAHVNNFSFFLARAEKNNVRTLK